MSDATRERIVRNSEKGVSVLEWVVLGQKVMNNKTKIFDAVFAHPGVGVCVCNN